MKESLFNTIRRDDFINFDKSQLLDFFQKQKSFEDKLNALNNDLHNFNAKLVEENTKLKDYAKELENKILVINGQIVVLRNKLFGKKSEKKLSNTNPKPSVPKSNSGKKKRKKTFLRPSERYPDAPQIERHLEFQTIPNCSCCGTIMEDSGMTEDTEFLTVVPAQYIVICQKRHKYRCGKCHGDVKTAPAPKRIIPGSTYSDDMITDIALTKYCDLIPIERYSAIAGREGLKDLPPHSLIGVTHNLADFVKPVYNRIREEIDASTILYADETPHKMLEGDKKSNWYLWGFSNSESSYFDIRDTRSGDIASELLNDTKCQYLISDVFSGYQKAVNVSNNLRRERNLPEIQSVYCNAHARRKFKEAENGFPEESQYFIEMYRKIYLLESEGKEDPTLLGKNRLAMKPLFEAMKKTAEAQKEGVSSKSSLSTAINYFLRNYKEFTIFLNHLDLPIDNNHQERQLRNPVIGRKTWYGTHSKRGAKTAAILFSIVESCKLNKVNPRAYFSKLVQSIHGNKVSFTPKEFKSMNFVDTG